MTDRGVGPAVVEARAGAVHEETSRFDPGGHVGEHELQALELGERAVELPPLLHVLERGVERTLGDAERLGADKRARAVERTHRVPEPGALLTDEVLGRNDAVVEDDLAGGRAAHPHLVLELPDRESREVFSTTNS